MGSLGCRTCCANAKNIIKHNGVINVAGIHFRAPRFLLKTLLCDTCCAIV